MIEDPKLMAAVSRIIQRSERQEDIVKLANTYVDVGILPQLQNKNHQVIYGRRGTGKTHLLKVLESALTDDKKNTVVYIDSRTLGSTSQFSDPDVPIKRRCLALFRDVLIEIIHSLQLHLVNMPTSNTGMALVELDSLSTLITEPLKGLKEVKITTENQASSSSVKSAGAILSDKEGIGANLKSERSKVDSQKSSTEYTVESQDKVMFPDLHRTLNKVLLLGATQLFVLIDEWSSLPSDIQPYLAEFLKRGLLPITGATLKIAALEYRSHFSRGTDGGKIGFELGADIATATDLDDYFVFDRNPDQITDVYIDVLLRHISSELPKDFMNNTFGVSTTPQFASRLFTERDTIKELARASEGVIRDLINIFTQAYFHAQRRGRKNIDKKAIIEAARQWFEQDKAQHLDEDLQNVLRRIIDEVIGKRQTRSFLLPRQLERNVVIQRLFDSRVLHHMQRGYADKDNPGLRYNIYTIDYGAYVDLIGTSKEPQIDLIERTNEDVVVPFDDKRSIRRVILKESILAQ